MGGVVIEFSYFAFVRMTRFQYRVHVRILTDASMMFEVQKTLNNTGGSEIVKTCLTQFQVDDWKCINNKYIFISIFYCKEKR